MRIPLSLLCVLCFATPSILGQGTSQSPTDQKPCTWISTIDLSATIQAQGAIGGVTVDAQGRVYVATFRDSVYRIELDGTRTLLNDTLGNASGNAIDHNGDLLQADFKRDKLYRILEDGTRRLVTRDLFEPVGVAVDSNGDIFVLNYGIDTISRITPAGVVSLYSSSPLLNGPNGIVITDNDAMYVANLKDNRLLRIRPNGTAREVAAVGNGQGIAHVTWLSGNLYVSLIWEHEVYQVTPSGQISRLAGTGVKGTRDGCAGYATLSHPNGITADPNRNILYTNNFIGIMGSNGGRITLRAIHMK